jgi:hypothetical protein
MAALLAVLLPALLGGRLRRLAEVRLRHTWVVSSALIAQILVIELLSGPRWLLSGAHVATYGAAAFYLWANRRVPGLLVLGLGGASNGIAIAVNGGTLPARAGALATAGIEQSAEEFVNSGVVHGARLAFLGDVFAIPDAWPLSNVFSVGDVLIVLGVGYASLRICGTRWTPSWAPRSDGHGRPQHVATGGRSPAAPAPPAAPADPADGAQPVIPRQRPRPRRRDEAPTGGVRES